MGLKEIDYINGIKLHYDRNPGDYGTRGDDTTFTVDETFLALVEKVFEEIEEKTGELELITSAGFHTPSSTGRAHREGKAMDIDGLFWEDGRKFVANGTGLDKEWDPGEKELYLGLLAIIMKYIPTTLHWWYNQPHKDHYHLQSVAYSNPSWRGSRSQLTALQAMLKNNWRKDVDVNGSWDKKTKRAVKDLFGDENIQGHWREFLDMTAKREFVETPRQKLKEIYELAEGDQEMLEALNDFRYDRRTDEWLKRWT